MAEVRVLALAGGVLGADLLEGLDAEAAADIVAVVVSHAPGGERMPCPLTVTWCERRAIPWRYVASWRDADLADLELPDADLAYSLAYDLILPARVLASGPERAVNLHRGIAPDFRGAYSTTWTLERGACELGVTLHLMAPEVDAGPILAQRRLPVTPAMTAAEAIPAVEALAVELCRDTLPDLLAGRLASRPQPAGGETFGRTLPGHALDEDEFPGLAARARALWNPPFPSAHVVLGERRLAFAEPAPTLPAPHPSALAPAAAPRVDNRPALTYGRPAAWTASVVDALALLRERVGRPLALPETAPPAWHQAVGADARSYPVGADLRPDTAALAAVSAGAAVVLAWPFGHPPDPALAVAITEAGGVLVEDRTQALLATIPPAGGWVLFEPGTTFDVGGGGLLLAPTGTAPVDPDTIEPAARFALSFLADFPTARRDAERATVAWAAAIGERCPWSHWPLGTFAHRYPARVDDAPAVAAALREAGVPAEVFDAGLIGLPCQGDVAAAVAAAAPVLRP
jgi:methionyl-tRNA formyltransferase